MAECGSLRYWFRALWGRPYVSAGLRRWVGSAALYMMKAISLPRELGYAMNRHTKVSSALLCSCVCRFLLLVSLLHPPRENNGDARFWSELSCALVCVEEITRGIYMASARRPRTTRYKTGKGNSSLFVVTTFPTT